MADVINEPLNEELRDTKESSDGNSFMANNDAMCVRSAEGSPEENSRNGIAKTDRHTNIEMLQAVTEETQLDHDEYAVIDLDEQELEEDDITSKLLSIQVLPRIPKRKPVTDNSSTTPVGETSSYCSVLERVNSAPSSVGARYSNWSAAGWSRSNIDRPPKRWNRKISKDKKAESKPVKRSVTEKQPKNDVKRKAEVYENKPKQAAEHSAWSPDAADVSSGPSLSEIEQIETDEGTAPLLAGPLPTLPFEEQMRERARLRNLKKQGVPSVGNNSSDATETALRNLDSNDSSKDGFDSAAAVSFLPQKTDASKPAVKQEQQNLKTPGFENITALSHSKSSENQRPLQRRPSENGHKAIKPNRRTNRTSAEDKANRLHLTRKDTEDTKRAESSGDEPMLKSKKEPASPPLPHLPILPLFATDVSETGDASLHWVENKTTASGKKTAALSSSRESTSSGNDIRDASSSNISKLKSATSAATTSGSKTVTFNSSTEIHGGGEAKKKSKPNVSYLPELLCLNLGSFIKIIPNYFG